MKQLLAALIFLLPFISQAQIGWKQDAEKYLRSISNQNAWLFENESNELLDKMIRSMIDASEKQSQNRYLMHLLATLSLKRNIGDYNRYLDAALAAHGTDSLSKALSLLEFSRYTQAQEDSPFYRDLLDSAGRILEARSETDLLLKTHLAREYADLYPYADDRNEPIAVLQTARRLIADSIDRAHPLYIALSEDLVKQYRITGKGVPYFYENKALQETYIAATGPSSYDISLWADEIPDLSVYKLSANRYTYYLLARLFEETSDSYYSKRMAARMYERAGRYTKSGAYTRRADFALQTGMMYLAADEYKQSVSRLENAVKLYGKSRSTGAETRSKTASILLSKALLGTGNYERAYDIYSELSVKNDLDFYNNLLLISYRAGKSEQTSRLLDTLNAMTDVAGAAVIVRQLIRYGRIADSLDNSHVALRFYEKAYRHLTTSNTYTTDDGSAAGKYQYRITAEGATVSPAFRRWDQPGMVMDLLDKLAQKACQNGEYSKCRKYLSDYVNEFYTAFYFDRNYLLNYTPENEKEKIAALKNELFPIYDRFHLAIYDDQSADQETEDVGLALQYLSDFRSHPQYELLQTVSKIEQGGDSLARVRLRRYRELLSEETYPAKQPELNNLRLLLSEDYPAFASPEKKMIGWKVIRQKLNKNEAVVEIRRLHDLQKDRTVYIAYVFSDKNESPQVIRFEDGNHMESKWKAFSSGRNSDNITRREIYDLFWKPIAASTKSAENIYLIPDGIFTVIDPAGLIDPVTNKRIGASQSIELLVSSQTLLQKDFNRNGAVTEATLLGNVETAGDLAADQLKYVSASFVKNRLKANLSESVSIPDNRATRGILYLDRPFVIELSEGSDRSGNTTVDYDPAANSPDVTITDSIRQSNLENVELVVIRAADENLMGDPAGSKLSELVRAFHTAGVRYQLIENYRTDNRTTQLFFDVFNKEYLRKKRSVDAAFDKAMETVRKKVNSGNTAASFILIH